MINIKISAGVILLIAIGIIVFIGLIIAFVILKDRKKDKDEIDSLIGDLLDSSPKEPEVIVKQIDPATNMEITEDIKPKVDLEAMLDQMQKDLEAKKENAIEKFEKEQEDKAIISYQELVDNFEKEKLNQQILKETNLYEKQQEEDAIISYQDLQQPSIEPMELFKEQEEAISNPLKEAIKKIESPREEQDKKFKNTEFISPIFGKMKEHLEYPTVKAFDKQSDFSLEEYFKYGVDKNKNDYSYEIEADNRDDLFERALGTNPLGDDIKKNDDFLQALKEFRSNL